MFSSDFYSQASTKYSDRFTYGEFTGQDKSLSVYCLKHKIDFITTPKNHLRSNYGCCQYCREEEKHIIARNAFFDKARIKFGDKYTYGKYKNSVSPIVVTCPRHGDYTWNSPNAHLNRDGCETCSDENLFLDQAHKKHGKKFSYGVYRGSRDIIEITCPDHGRVDMLPKSHLTRQGCAKCGEANRFFERAKSKFGDKYSYGIFDTFETNIKITCPDHGTFQMLARSHLARAGCRACGGSKLKSDEQFLEEARRIHGDKFQYGEYVHARTHMSIICPQHGEFKQSPDGHLGGSGCAKCANNVRLDKEAFIERSKVVHSDKFNYNTIVFDEASKFVMLECKDHGMVKLNKRNHLKGGPCPQCSKRIRLTHERFVMLSRLAHGDTYEYPINPDIRSLVATEIICSKHGSFFQVPHNHFKLRHGCPKCSKIISRKEMAYLTSIGLPDDPQHRQVRLRIEGTKRGFLVDGFDPLTNTVYEFHGDYWHGNPNRYDPNDLNVCTEKTFADHYDKTIRKENLIRDAGYRLEVMWETDWDNSQKSS